LKSRARHRELVRAAKGGTRTSMASWPRHFS
jgi:hypothetical protein